MMMDENSLKYGCKVLSDGLRGINENVLVDVIFVHGLMGSWIETWTYYSNGGSSVTWPCDLLPSDIPEARIITFGYDADITALKRPTGQSTLDQHAQSLNTHLQLLRRQSNTTKRPIIFVCHSLGGIVVETALLLSTHTPYLDIDEIAKTTAGVVFMGTPHCGSDLANFATTLANIVKLFRPVNKDLLNVLCADSQLLRRTQSEFVNWQKQNPDVNIANFYEEVPSVLPGGKTVKIVEDNSSMMYGFLNVSIHGDHKQIVKFSGKTHPGYVLVCCLLQDWVKEIKATLERLKGNRHQVKPPSEQYYDSAILKRRLQVFVGRKDLLDEIHQYLANLPQGKRNVVLQGLGGVGKTQAAIQYTFDQHFESRGFDKIFWVDASYQRTARASFARIADEIGPKEIKTQDVLTKINYVQTYLSNEDTEWLLVLDNFDSPRQFQDIGTFMPQCKSANIIVTSRHRDSNRLGAVLHVGGMSDDDAVELLLQSSEQKDNISPEEKERCIEIVHSFGNLPLAVDQAGAYMGKKRMKPSTFLKRYRNNRELMLKYHPSVWSYSRQLDESDPEKEVYLNAFSTWELSLREIGQAENVQAQSDEMQPAAQLLLLSAFFDRTKLSEFIFGFSATGTPSHAPRWLTKYCVEDGIWNSEKFGSLVDELADLCLLEKSEFNNEEERYEYSLHPLVQEWARLRLSKEERNEYVLQTIWIMADILALGNYAPKLSDALNKNLILASLDACIRNDEEYGDAEQGILLGCGNLAEVTLKFASFYLDHGHYNEARTLYQYVTERNPDPSNAIRLFTHNAREGLAVILMLEGKYDEARIICKEALEGYTKLLGEDSFERLRALHNLTEINGGQGDYTDCVASYREISTKFEKALGPDHYITLRETEGLGNSLRVTGKFEEAAEYLFRALSGMKKIVDADNPDLLGIVEGCGIVRREQRRFEEAEELYQQALAGDKISLGLSHPDTLNVEEELGDLWAAQGDFAKAFDYYQRARDGRWEILGPKHPDTVRTLHKIEEVRATKATTIDYKTFFYPWYFPVSSFTEALKGATEGSGVSKA